MSDSPAVKIPLDPKEQPILDSLYRIRNQLELMKQDRSCFVKSDDVVRLYQDTLAQVHIINDLRTNKREEQNRVDTVLDDCFQLISLGFMTIGRCSEAPALYSVVATVKRLLDHLKQVGFYSPKDLEHIESRLKGCREYLEKGKDNHDSHLVLLLETRLDICDKTLAELQEVINYLTPDLLPVYDKLVSILRTLSACNVRSKFPRDEVEDLRAQLHDIQKEYGNPDFKSLLNTPAESYHTVLQDVQKKAASDPQILISDLLARCILWSEIILQHPAKIDEKFRDVFDKLISIRNALESKSLLQSWSMRETDLYSYQRQLDRIDESRDVDGNFVDGSGHVADIQTERTLLYLIRKSYSLIYFLLTSSEPVSEALLPIYNQLKTLRKCLKEVQKAGGVSSSRELYPYQMKLNSIDKIRVDGKFMVNNSIPDGQAAVMQLLEDCYEITHELKEDADAAENEEEQDEGIHIPAQQVV